jgi:hypothetical protein
MAGRVSVPVLLKYEINEIKRDSGRMRKTDRGENCIMMNFTACIIRVIKSRRMRWAGHVARMKEGRGVYRVLVGRLTGKT